VLLTICECCLARPVSAHQFQKRLHMCSVSPISDVFGSRMWSSILGTSIYGGPFGPSLRKSWFQLRSMTNILYTVHTPFTVACAAITHFYRHTAGRICARLLQRVSEPVVRVITHHHCVSQTRVSEFRSATHHLECTRPLDRLFRGLDKLRKQVLIQHEREVRLEPRLSLLLLLLMSLPTRGGARPWRGGRRLRMCDDRGNVQKRPVHNGTRQAAGERAMTLPVSLKSAQCPRLLRTRKSSIDDQTGADVVAQLLVHLGIVCAV
jgi:hypothetical protein